MIVRRDSQSSMRRTMELPVPLIPTLHLFLLPPMSSISSPRQLGWLENCRHYRMHRNQQFKFLAMMVPPHSPKDDDVSLSFVAPSLKLKRMVERKKLNTLRSIILQQINTTTPQSKQFRGRLYLLIVSFLYGTLYSTLRAMYAMDGKPSPSVLSFVRQMLSIATFLPMLFFASRKNAMLPANTLLVTTEGKEEVGRGMSSSFSKQVHRPEWKSALELAFWNFGAQGLLNAGLVHTSAARASFLTQTSVVLTPLLSAVAGEHIKAYVWVGCGLALFGLSLIATSAAATTATSAAATEIAILNMFNKGDTMILAGALSWSMYIFRTSKLAQHHPALNLQFTKTIFLALMYGGWLLSDVTSTLAAADTSFLTDGWWRGGVLASLWPASKSPTVWILLVYSAIGPGVLADILQQRGQGYLDSASESNIILCLESVFGVMCAFVTLGELVSLREIAGGSLIVTAAVLASR